MNRIAWVGIAALALLAVGCASDDSGSSKAPDCSKGTQEGKFSKDVPTWIQNNFSCVKVKMDGDTIVIQTRDLPPYTSYYYGSDHDRYDPTEPTTPNPNLIAEQDYEFRIPSNPAIAGSTSESGLGEIGVAVDGVVLFNNQANPPDTLAEEVDTLDVNTGHATEQGIYHYHVEAANLSADDDNLVGIAIDGFPIFGAREADNSIAVDATADSPAEPSGGNWFDDHTHTAVSGNFPDTIAHYHIVSNWLPDGATEVRYLVSSQLAGTAGSVSNGN